MKSECALCHNFCLVEEFYIFTSAYPDGRPKSWYNHPNCAKCRAMLESFGIKQEAPW